MKWIFSSLPPHRGRCDALCVLAGPRGKTFELAAGDAAPGPGDMVRAWARHAEFKGEPGDVGLFPTWGRMACTHVVAAGIGALPAADPWRVERAAAAAVRLAVRHGARSIAFVCPADFGPDGALLRALARGAVTGLYRYDTFRTSADAHPAAGIRSMTLCGPADAAANRRALEAGTAEGEVLNEVADLANLPGCCACPQDIADAARRLARRYGLRCTVWDERELARRGCHALLAVGKGSRTPPRLIVLEHRGKGRGAPLALVGKTITFDSGGLSLKTPKSMELMRNDKSGGMAVLAAMVTAARLRLPRRVVGLLAAAENMPGSGATRPGDIVRSKSGTTIEILNTDAEGRLVLADALSVAADFQPAAIVDIATLTGAASIALGRCVAAILSRDDALTAALRAAGDARGERLWPLPLWPDYDADLRTPYADIKNSGDGSAGTIIGGTFLKRFVPETIPWAHLDIAATAHDEKERSWRGEGATLFGARLLVEWLERAAAAPAAGAGKRRRGA